MNINNIMNICFLLLILSFETCQSLLIIPRCAQSSVRVGNGIYFFGGVSVSDYSNMITINQILYLDVSKSFEIINPDDVPFEEIQNVSNPFSPFLGSFSKGLYDSQKNIIYLLGGSIKSRNEPMSILHSYNLETNKLDIPKTIGTEPRGRIGIDAVITNNKKIYIFDGAYQNNTEIFNDMNIFDTTSLTWSNGSMLNAPPPRMGYTATLLSNGKIVFIGGAKDIDINASNTALIQLPIYDTISDSWSSMTVENGDLVENRYQHSAVLTPDEKIIIFGGSGNNGGLVAIQLVVLDTKKTQYEWFIPKATSTPPTLASHSATLVGNYMLVNFGFPASGSNVPISFFYILDIRNYTWVNKFEPEILPEIPDNGKNIGIIIGIVCGCVGVSAITGLLVRKIYKSYNRQKHQRNIPHYCENPVRYNCSDFDRKIH